MLDEGLERLLKDIYKKKKPNIKIEYRAVLSRTNVIGWLAGVLGVSLLLAIAWMGLARAEINMPAICQIESSGNPLAYNKSSGAVGLYQITPVCLADYNLINKTNHKVAELRNPVFNHTVAHWYLNKRIPQMLKKFKKPATTENILWAYNAGIGRLIKGIKPLETRKYITKYKLLSKEA